MTFAIVAFLIGGFAINANAQEDNASKSKKTETTTNNNVTVQKVDYDQMLKDYETYINQYIEKYKQSLKEGTSSKVDWKTPLKKAQELQQKLENAKKDLNDKQIAKFVKLKEKLAEALKRK